MSARMAAVTGERPRRVVTRTRSVMRTLGSVASVMLATFCVAGVAKAETDWPLEGRWAALNESLTLDLSLCGDGWCGVEVTSAGSCGPTMLRTRSRNPEETGVIIGRLELAAQARPYVVALHLYKRGPDGSDRRLLRGSPDTLMIRGNTGGEFNFMRRMYPYMVAFARVGDAACRQDPKVS